MYFVYDNYGGYVAKTDSLHWAKKMANANDGYVMEWEDGDYYMVYDCGDAMWEWAMYIN